MVISILGIMSIMVTVNLPGLRVDRNLNIAQNELVTNLRRAQSYTLSSHVVPGGQSPQFFILKFDAGSQQSRQKYTLQAMYNVTSSPVLVDVENYIMPPGIQVSSTPIRIYAPAGITPSVQAPACGLLAFGSPFAKVYLNAGCNISNFQPLVDDYANIINYVTNVNNYHTTTDSYAVITLTDAGGTKFRQVMVRGVSGVICPTKDGATCSN